MSRKRYSCCAKLFNLLAVCVLLAGSLPLTAETRLLPMAEARWTEEWQALRSGLPVWSEVMERSRPATHARISLEPMFSAQYGSWPFEPFVHAGLFATIAGYQEQHPRVILVEGGWTGLAELHERIGDDRIIRREGQIYYLSWPLLIAADAALYLEGETLLLREGVGAAIINLGQLAISNATLGSWGTAVSNDTGFRGFVMNWAGSQLVVDAAHITNLGSAQHLMRGIGTALSSGQPADTPRARVLVRNSHFEGLVTGLELVYAQAQIEATQFEQLRHYAVDVRDSRIRLEGNRIRDIQQLSGIRVQGDTRGSIVGNQLQRAYKSAMEISDFSGRLLASDNQLGAGQGHGFLLRDTTPAAVLVLTDNLIGYTRRSLLDAANIHQLSLVSNRFLATPEYAVSIDNQQSQGSLQLVGNDISRIGKSMIRTHGIARLVLGHNRFQANPLQQNLLIGDLLPLQGALLEASLREGCMVEALIQEGSAAMDGITSCR